MTVYVNDPDFRLYHGGAVEVLAELEAGSVHCCVTSPPYWGLRDYGTGTWEGGGNDCDHAAPPSGGMTKGITLAGTGDRGSYSSDGQYRNVCGKCGATRVDRQIGLEQTPDEYVARMVDVFREVRRVLRDDGTLWLNLGDSYAHSTTDWAPNRGAAARPYDSGRIGHGLKPKDLVGIPWRVAFALQEAGWWLRSDIIWSKPNPMPESVTDRPTKAHEYVFLLSKSARYYFDADAVREGYEQGWRGRLDTSPATAGRIGGPGGFVAKGPDGRRKTTAKGGDGSHQHRDGERWPHPDGRNIRSVWEIATRSYAEAHFATFPLELPRRCIAAGTPPGGVVLDPFMGAGTTALAARNLGRRSVGVELNADYCAIAARRLGQQSLLAEVPHA